MLPERGRAGLSRAYDKDVGHQRHAIAHQIPHLHPRLQAVFRPFTLAGGPRGREGRRQDHPSLFRRLSLPTLSLLSLLGPPGFGLQPSRAKSRRRLAGQSLLVKLAIPRCATPLTVRKSPPTHTRSASTRMSQGPKKRPSKRSPGSIRPSRSTTANRVRLTFDWLVASIGRSVRPTTPCRLAHRLSAYLGQRLFAHPQPF